MFKHKKALNHLGSIAKEQGEYKNARQFWTESRDLYRTIGTGFNTAEMQRKLDALPQ